uniref:Glucosylceramidase n=1 Tax=Acrobeloides nanus TaxID=290746 RepID=A0A914E762_9BILA
MVWDESRGACDPYNKTTCGADKFVDVILADQAASSYVDGIAFHWYADAHTNTSVLDHLQRTYSKQWILYTEACAGLDENKPDLGNWTRAEQYAHDIIDVKF